MLLDDIKEKLPFMKKMKVYAFVGPSGTGKSYRAQMVAGEKDTHFIIDDGLLIKDNEVVAGESAKKATTKVATVKHALFYEDEEKQEIIKALKKYKPQSILILGTSDGMVQKIAANLGLPEISETTYITDVATKQEMETARRIRVTEGKHVIPVPSIEVKRNYPQIFYDAMRVLFKKKTPAPGSNNKMIEKSVVRPEFSKKGRVEISEGALSQMIIHCILEFDSNIVIKKLTIKTDAQGYRLVLCVDVPFGNQLTGTIYRLQQYIIENVERYTGILIEEVNIIIDQITRRDTE